MRRLAFAVTLAALAAASLAHAAETPPPEVRVYTMGPGDDVFSRFGHAAICFSPAGAPDGGCFNYGTADFSTPLPLTWDFLRGRARFWVSTASERLMVAAYARHRTVYRQRLPLTPAQAEMLAHELVAGTGEDRRYYHYHHFHDNCTTRIRDLIDRVTGGQLRAGEAVHEGPSFRDYARRGFAGDLPLLVVTELLLGRAAEGRTSTWQAMFLPDVLRDALRERLGATAETVGVAPASEPGLRAPAARTELGRWALGELGGVLGLWVLVWSWLARRAGSGATPAAAPGDAVSAASGAGGGGGILGRLALAVPAVVLGLGGLLVWLLALLSSFPELVYNEVLLVLWPADLLLPLFSPRIRRGYVRVRLAALVAVALGAVLGLFVQPLWAPLLLCAVPLLCATRLP